MIRKSLKETSKKSETETDESKFNISTELTVSS